MCADLIHNIYLTALILGLVVISEATPHDHGHVKVDVAESSVAAHAGHNHGAIGNNMTNTTIQPSYFRHPHYASWMYAHIAFMILAWIIVLPIGVMLSIARSRHALWSQFVFFALNGVGLAVGIVYNASTPDLYQNNAHHKMGWALTWITAVWIVLGIFNNYARQSRQNQADEVDHEYSPLGQSSRQSSISRRWSDDSGHGTDGQSEVCSSPSPTIEHEKYKFLRGTSFDSFLSKRLDRPSNKIFTLVKVLYTIVERFIILLAFAAICTGFVTYGGVFRGNAVFTGLAHIIKGGIFFWIGILAISRWAGAFADLGWAWNIQPPAKKRTVSHEMVESALICIYGASNVWLEHLAAWGETWTPMDYEHISITILFFGGGLLGMLVESQWIRKLLNSSLSNSQTSYRYDLEQPQNHVGSWKAPDTVATPLNPLPALTILLLGVIMAAHTQDSVLAATMHTMWGALFALAAMFRLSTYMLHYLRPPTSYLPSRPPTELLAGFCLVAGGFMFMISPRDITSALEASGADAMVAFVVSMGVTAVICAGVVACMAVKGWAVAREERATSEHLPNESLPM